MHTLKGSCHCGNIILKLNTPHLPQELWLRKCPCVFCHKQGNINVADPEGNLEITINDNNKVFYYQMGHKTSNRLFCGVCGVYIGGLMEHDSQSVCVLNANTLGQDYEFMPPTEINVSSQTSEERIQGRLKRWMPYTINAV